MVRAWIYDETDVVSLPQAAHQTTPVEWVTLRTLASLGVDYWRLAMEAEHAAKDPEIGRLGEIRRDRSYRSHDYVQVTPEKLPNYEEKIKMFFREHLHEDEEIRFCLGGSGYFDVRNDLDGRWIRIEVEKGDMIVLPPGMYHRYTNDLNGYVHMMRLFRDNPKWEAIDRGERAEVTPSRKQYLQTVIEPAKAKLATVTPTPTLTGANGSSWIVRDGAAPLANYPHMRAANGFLFVGGTSSRLPTNPVTYAGVTKHEDGTVELDIAAQTRAVLQNIERILSSVGANLGHLVDMTVYLRHMSDYAAYNKVFNEFFPVGAASPTRTTIGVSELPLPELLIEIKATAVDPRK